jgi:peptidoglycan/xylan/chitin deacetylase (PgdA/CDA1 family)
LLLSSLVQFLPFSLSYDQLETYYSNLATTLEVGAESISIKNSSSSDRANTTASTTNKVAILSFDDGWKSQYTNATPILNKYGFKATFYVVCNYIGKGESRLNWQDVVALYKQGHDIGSHSMNHDDLTKVSKKDLNFEIGQSKQCLLDHGINNVTSFAYPFSEAAHQDAVVKIVSKYYDFARTGNDPLMFLHCNIGRSDKSNQSDCRTYTDDGKLTFVNRYSIIGWSQDHERTENSYDDTKMLRRFIEVVNSQINFNSNGTINAIPIIKYHKVDNNSKDGYSTGIDLFAKEMKYLHDNGFKVLTMRSLAYDESNNYLYVKKDTNN